MRRKLVSLINNASQNARRGSMFSIDKKDGFDPLLMQQVEKGPGLR